MVNPYRMNSISIMILGLLMITFCFETISASPARNFIEEKDLDSEGSGAGSHHQSSPFHSNISDEFSSPALIRWKRDSNATTATTTTTTTTTDPNKIESNTNKPNEKEKDNFSLEDVIFKIEESFIKAAVDVVTLLKMNHSGDFNEDLFEDLVPPPAPSVSVGEKPTETNYKVNTVNKRDAVDGNNRESEQNRKTPQYSQNNAIPIYTKIYTRSVPENSVDVIPTFDYEPLLKSNPARQRRDLQNSKDATVTTEKSNSSPKDLSEKSTELPHTSTTSSSSGSTTKSITTSSSPFNLKLDKLTAPDIVETVSNSTESSSSAATKDILASTTPVTVSTTSETSKTPIEELKDKEKEVKEKVAEVEAEPIILSSRV